MELSIEFNEYNWRKKLIQNATQDNDTKLQNLLRTHISFNTNNKENSEQLSTLSNSIKKPSLSKIINNKVVEKMPNLLEKK